MPDFSAAKARLEATLAELQGRQASISRDLDEPQSADWDDRAIEREDDEALERQAILVSAEIASVKRALSRMRKRTYGRCVRCDAQISPDRLEARPEAALCIACAARVELTSPHARRPLA